MKPILSIITVVLNGENLIASCLENVISQRCPEVEHLVMDGGSTDGTMEIVRRYAAAYPHIRWFSEKDQGQSDAMNKGIARAVGDILGFLNFDDYYEPDVLNNIIKIFEAMPEPAIVFGNCRVWDAEGKLVYTYKPRGVGITNLLLKDDLYIHPVNPSAYFYHKSLHDTAGDYDVTDPYAMDLDFLIRAVTRAHVKIFPEAWGNMRLTYASKTQTTIQAGTLINNMETVKERYRRQLPLMQKIWLYLNIFIRKVFRFVLRCRQRLLKSVFNTPDRKTCQT